MPLCCCCLPERAPDEPIKADKMGTKGKNKYSSAAASLRNTTERFLQMWQCINCGCATAATFAPGAAQSMLPARVVSVALTGISEGHMKFRDAEIRAQTFYSLNGAAIVLCPLFPFSCSLLDPRQAEFGKKQNAVGASEHRQFLACTVRQLQESLICWDFTMLKVRDLSLRRIAFTYKTA